VDKPTLIEWRAEYSVGDALLDAQHKKLLSLCAKAEALIGQTIIEEASDKFHELLNEISVYAQVHFATEEGLLKRLNYPDLKAQEESHRQYIETMTELIIDTMHGKMDAVAVYQFLTSWWLDHIVAGDMKFKSLIQSHPHFVRKA